MIMSWNRKQGITLGALIMVISTALILWRISNHRHERKHRDQLASEIRKDPARVVTTRRVPKDYDGDGFTDSTDACPTRPETQNGFQDGNGCPDIVAKTGAS